MYLGGCQLVIVDEQWRTVRTSSQDTPRIADCWYLLVQEGPRWSTQARHSPVEAEEQTKIIASCLIEGQLTQQ